MTIRATLTAILAATIFSTTATAQVTTASFYAILNDATGAAIPAANVTMVNEGTGTTVMRASDATGEFGFDFLRIGAYTLLIEAKGFKKFESKNINLTAGQSVRQTFTLEV